MLRAPPEAVAIMEKEGGFLCADKAGEAFRVTIAPEIATFNLL